MLIYNETKSKTVIDKNEKKIDGVLKYSGSKNKNIQTYKIGPTITDKEEIKLSELDTQTIKNLKESKKKDSWKMINDVSYKKEIIEVKNNIIEKKYITLENYLKQKFYKLNDKSKSFVEAKDKFDSDNFNIKNDMTDNEYEQLIRKEYNNYSNFEEIIKKNIYENSEITDSDS